jgi:hypothetical protein
MPYSETIAWSINSTKGRCQQPGSVSEDVLLMTICRLPTHAHQCMEFSQLQEVQGESGKRPPRGRDWRADGLKVTGDLLYHPQCVFWLNVWLGAIPSKTSK